MKASHEKSLSEASKLHLKEFEILQTQFGQLKMELSSSKDKTRELEKTVSELQTYKEQAQVSTASEVCKRSKYVLRDSLASCLKISKVYGIYNL